MGRLPWNFLRVIIDMNTNVLITSAGKRVTLTSLFKKELNKLFPDSSVYTTDMNPTLAPAGYVSDGCFKVPRVTDKSYLTSLLEICEEKRIGMIIPTIDTELLLLAENKVLLRNHGVEVIVSDSDFVKACRDKRNSNALFQNLHIRVPETRDKFNPVFPMFAKPYDGSLSKDLFVILSPDSLTPEVLNHPKLIFMEYIDKNQYKEFTVDLYYSRDHRLKCIVPRERLEIRAGEINKGITRKNYLVPYLKERMECMPGVVGCICVQLFYREVDNDVVAIEINPRFGGGYPMSYHAGANYPAFLIQEYFENKSIDYTDMWLDNTLLLRYDSEIVVYGK